VEPRCGRVSCNRSLGGGRACLEDASQLRAKFRWVVQERLQSAPASGLVGEPTDEILLKCPKPGVKRAPVMQQTDLAEVHDDAGHEHVELDTLFATQRSGVAKTA